MTYGYGPPREWNGAEEDPDASPPRRRRPPPPPEEPPPGRRAGEPTSGWAAGPVPSEYGTARPRIPQPPPPARHLGTQSGQATPYSSPPARPASGPPGGRGRPAPPNNAGSQPTAYPTSPPPVPTSPTVPRMPPHPQAARPGAAPLRPPVVAPTRQAPGRPATPPPPSGRQATPPPPGRQPAGPGRPAPASPARPGPAPAARPGPNRPGTPTPAAARALTPRPATLDRPRSVKITEAVPGLIRHLPHHKPWMVALSAIALVVVIATCGLGSYLLVKDDTTVVGAEPEPTQTVPRRDITTRESDPLPMKVDDVFPKAEITVDATIPPYKRVGNPQVSANCLTGASSDLGKLLVTLGCNQVIRATFTSTEGAYLVTAGIFNMKDSAAANQDTDIKNLVDASKGRFSGYVSGADAKMLGRSATKLAWNAQGHFILYAVIARVDGKEFSTEDDPHVTVIVYDIVEKYLRDSVVGTWSIDHSTPGPSVSASS